MITATTLVVLVASGAIAQETYGDLFEQGALGDVSHMEEQIGKLLLANGVSEDCVGKLTLNDVSRINLVIGMQNSPRQKEQRVLSILTEKCS
jgi:hypothetical protein